ncbi:MAG: hypothetical protein ACRD1Y_11295 [Terriglobales bacterium]
MKKIAELQESLRKIVPSGVPAAIIAGLEPQVSLKHPDGSKIYVTSDLDKFKPAEGDQIVITFHRTSKPPAAALPPAAAQLIRVLDQALAHRNFVALKWFRDVELPHSGFTPEQARTDLTRAIQEGWVLVSKLANPKSSFPTSTLQLDRGSPAVQEALASPSPLAPPRGFTPVRLPAGVSASKIIIEDRR